MSKQQSEIKPGRLARRPFSLGPLVFILLCMGLQPFAARVLLAQPLQTEVITGTPGVAKYKATMNFSNRAQSEALQRARRPAPERAPRATPLPDIFGRSRGEPEGSSSSAVSAQNIQEISGAVEPQGISAIVGPSPSPSLSFPALEDNGVTIPPDTMGAVGPNHVMTTLNSQIRIQDRQGAVISTVDLNTFWAPIGFPDAFDPRVLYDPYRERWIVSSAADAPLFGGFFSFSSVLLAVSETSDPTGNWFLYRVIADEFFATWADYPTIGFNKDWITISVNMFTADFFPVFAGVQMFVFDKANVMTNGLGNFTRLHIPTDPFFGLVRSFTMVPAVTYDPNLPELHLVDIFDYGNNFVNSRLRLSTISGEVGREILRFGTSITTNVINWAPTYFNLREGFAPQLGTTALIDTGDARMGNVVYRNGSLWCTHSVFLPPAGPDHTAVQWWQLAPTPTNAVTLQFGRIEDTNAVEHFAFPSIAVNRCNDVMIGFSSFSSNQFASASYSFRFGSDPTNAMRSGTIFKPGEGPYLKTFFSGVNRWGDYSATVVDPVNDLDMWTIQEYAETPFIVTTNFFDFGRWGTWWSKVEVAGLAQCGLIEFAQAAYSVMETNQAIITVTNLTGAAGTVDYRTSDGTARVNEDYYESSGTLTFAPGQKLATFTVDILDEAVLRSNRTVNLTLFNVTGGASLGTLTNAVLTIIDDEFVEPPNIAGEFNFSTYFDTNVPLPWMTLNYGPAYFITDWERTDHFCGTRRIISPERRAPGALITIVRTGQARGRVMVDFSTAEGGTAVPFQDYMPTNYTLIFDDFQTSTNVLVRLPEFPDLIPNGDKYVRLVLSNPRPAPEEEAENPGMIRPTLGPGAASQIVIIEITHGDRAFFFGGIGFNSLSNYIPAFAFERFNFRVDEYFDNNATDVSGGIREIPVDVVFPFPLAPRQGGRCIFRTDDQRVLGVRTVEPFTSAGSDVAESYPNAPGSGDPFSGFTVFPNPIFTDPSLTTITNRSDYEGVEVELTWTPNQCRQTVILQVTNDATVEYNEDIVCRLFGIVGEPFFPHFFADQCTVTILYHDQPAGALDREWNPDNVAMPGRDPDFDQTPGANDTVYAVAVQPDSKTLLAGDFTAVNGWPRRRIARMNIDGGIDLTFDPGDGAEQAVTGISLVNTNATGATNGGKILICGSFRSFNSYLHSGLTRLLPNGQVDPTFNPGKGADGPVWGIAQQSDGKIIVAGDFGFFNNVQRRRVARLFPDGALDLSFNADPGPDFAVSSVATTTNAFGVEKILLSGDFLNVNGQPSFRIAQLLPDGSLDPSFSAGAGADRSVYSVLVQTNGLILVAGGFTTINDTPRLGVARLMPDGSLDPAFDPGYGANDSVYTMTLQRDGKILIGGVFTEYNRTRRMGLARLRYDGTLDTSFLDTAYNQFAGFTHPFSFLPPNFVNSIALQPDGNVMVGGSFTNVGGNPAARHALRNNYTVFTRADKRNRFNIARLLGGETPGPGNAEFDASDYVVDENGGTVSVRMNRTDGRLGTLLGRGITEDRIATSSVDYTQSTNSSPWIEANRRDRLPMLPRSLGQVSPVYFRIPILDDTLEEGDELVDLSFVRAEAHQNLFGEIIPLGGALGRAAAKLNIVDNDFPKGEFNFLYSQYVTNEFTTNAVQAIITVIRTNGSHGAVSVEYFTRNSPITPAATATGPTADYVPINPRGRLQFASGQTTNFFTITILNDDSVEFDENIELVLTNATGGAKLPGGTRTSIATSTLTIVDDDFQPGRMNFSVNTFTNTETEGYATITVTRTGGALGTVSVQYRTVDGSATNPADYQSRTGTLTWNNGDTVPKIIQVPLIVDGRVEGPESFRIQLFDPRVAGSPDARLLGSRTNSLVTIADGDAYGTVAFSQPYYFADENAAMVSVTVLRTAGSSETLSVNYSAGPDSAVPGVDFTPVSGTLVFNPGQTSTNFVVPLLDDSETDGNKAIRLSLLNPTPTGALLGVPDTVILTLVDNESFVNPPGENDSTFQGTAGASGPVYSLGLYLTNGIFDGRLMIAGAFTNVNNITRQSVARLLPDARIDTTFDVGVGPNGPVRSMIVQSDGKILLGGEFTQVTGTNRNGIVRFNTEGTLDRFFNPGAGADGPVYALALQPNEKILVGGAFSRFNDEPRPRLVRLNTNAIVDTTFNAGAGPSGLSGTIYALALQPDGKVLVGGEFTQFDGVTRPGLARLHRDGRVDMSFNAGAGFNAAVRAIVVQPDGKIVVGGSFTTVNGVARNFLARLDAFGNLDTQFLSGLTAADNSVHALALQVDGKIIVTGDFTRFNGVTRNRITRLNTDGTTDPTINFGTGADSFIAAVAIQPDRKIVIGGGFTTFDGQPRRRFARLYGGSVSGPGSIEFTTDPFVTDETATNALVIVRRRGGTTGTVGVNCSTFDGTALAGRDYLPTNVVLSFPTGEAVRNVFVPILDNSTPNVDRALGLALNNYTGGAAVGTLPNSSLVILNDEALVSFTKTNFVTSEGDPSGLATISAVRTLGTNTPFSVGFAIVGGTATAFADYVPTNGTLTFNPGDLIKNFYVPILDDPFIEGTEYLTLSLQGPTAKAFLGTNTATLSILDNDFAPGQILLSSSSYVVDEAGGSVEITILRTNGRTGTITFDIGCFDGTARTGFDYVQTNATIAFADGELVKTIRVPILVDFISEPSETFEVRISRPTGGATLVAPTNATVTILNNDRPSGTFVFSTASPTVVENASVLNLQVYRVNGSVSNATVNFTTMAATATANVDYGHTSGTLVFPPGVTNQLIQIPIYDDALQEGAENFVVSLSSPSFGSGLGTPSAVPVQIIDNDSPIIIAAGATLVSETITNNVIDAGERVTLRFGLRNVGFTNTADLRAAVQISGGVLNPVPASATYGVVVANGPTNFQNIALTANVTNNGLLTVSLALTDGGRNLGTLTYVFRVGSLTYNFANTNRIIINDNTNATPYPSSIFVSDVSGTITKVTATVSNMTHFYPTEIDILLVGPSGDAVMLMSDAGWGAPINGVTIRYTDSAATAPPRIGQITSGDCLPSNWADDDSNAQDFFPLPAPAATGTWSTNMFTFNGKNANGAWSLYVVDDTTGDGGLIAGGWSLSITTSTPVNDTPPTLQYIGLSSTGQYRLAVRGQPGLRYSLSSSTDLKTYTSLQTFIMPNGGLYYYSETPTGECKFFRATKQP